LDCVIAGGMLVDGTGGAARRADVGIRDGRVVAIGKMDESAQRVIDAEGRVVAPGFVDVHTHYDAQVMWDAASLHGVTTVIGGNCGFTIAPVSDDSADYVMRMLACVEGMPVSSLEAVLDFRWETFAEWLALLDGHMAVNAGFSVGHSTIRKLVMGDAWQEAPSPEQLARMAQVVDESVAGGALGFSSSWGSAHGDHEGNRVPSRYAAADELVALASVLGRHEGTTLEFIPPIMPIWSDEVVDMMIAMSVGARSPLNWNLLSVGHGVDRQANETRLSASDRAAARGGEIIALSMPVVSELRLNLLSTIAYNPMPAWQQVLTLPFPQKMKALSDPDTRRRMTEAAEESYRVRPSRIMEFDKMTVQSVTSPHLKDLEGRLLSEIARERDRSALDVFLDIAVADELLTCFKAPAAGDDDASWRERAEYWQDPRVLVGGSDAGAHLDMMSTFAFFTDFVGPTVRDRGLLPLEDAVHKVTDAPARLYGLRDRGRIAPGYHADVVVFDPDTIRTGDVTLRQDMPDNQCRLFADAIGIDHVIANGVEIVDHGALTGATPGTILRSGRDTETQHTHR
jgi:N-acyl-D-aspartate/D-glutamate deacylase